MHPQDQHIAEIDLLLELDGELTPARCAEVRRHLESCWNCRARRAKLERTITALVESYQSEADVPADEGPRALLRARLANATEDRRASSVRLVAIGAGAAAMIVLSLFLARPHASTGPIPNARLTPGATMPVRLAQLCAGQTDEVRTVDAVLARRVFEQYGIRNPEPRSFEVDYLITPALGGSDDIRNLWPQPYADGAWNSRIKDALEDRLREMVCSGQLELGTAQREIARDWIAAYRKYFHTQTPLVSHAGFVKDRPWE